MTEAYVQVEPPAGSDSPEAAVEVLDGLERFTTRPDQDSLSTGTARDQPPVYEFLVLSPDESGRVEFFYGADGGDLDTLRTELRTCYPLNFELSPAEVDPQQYPAPNVVSEPTALVRAVRNDALWADLEVGAPSEIVTAEDAVKTIRAAQGHGPAGRVPMAVVPLGGRVYADGDTTPVRPAAETPTGSGVQRDESDKHRRDWTGSLTRRAGAPEDMTPKLSTVLGFLYQVPVQLAFKLLFERRSP